jgi:phosphoribosyl-dephospho-CoA transferase
MMNQEMCNSPQVHDLLEIEPDSLIGLGLAATPSWARETLNSCPWVVVRRSYAPTGQVAVGVRGAIRANRWSGFCVRDGVRNIVRPEELVALSRASTLVHKIPALKAICELDERWSKLALLWGVAGSAGFELATGRQVTTETSDLDVIIRAPRRLSKQAARFIWRLTVGLAAHADVLVETPQCGFSLEEYAHTTSHRILLRCKDGSLLGDDPWATSPIDMTFKVAAI